jgi:tripartite-type tricarboxylate transporter receptor subunit TctC
MLALRPVLNGLRIAGAAIAAMLALQSGAQTFPNRPITVIYPFGAGGIGDNVLRPVSAEAGKLLGQPIVFEDRPGANGRLGIAAMRSAKPDGYLVSFALEGLLIQQPLADPNFKLEVEKDYVPIAFVMSTPLVFTANPSAPFRDIKSLIAYARSNPGKVNMSVLQGASTHFIGELLRQIAEIDITLIPYKSNAQAMVDLVEGRIHMSVSSLSVKPFIDSGKVIGLGTSGKERWSAFPNLPTLIESGLPISSTTWFALIAPVGTPREAVVKLNNAFNGALRQPLIQKLYETAALGSAPMSPEELSAMIKSEVKLWDPVIRKAGIKMQ